MDLAELIGSAGVVKDAFCGRGLTRINVRDNPNVAS
jgi:hypothetical protein